MSHMSIAEFNLMVVVAKPAPPGLVTLIISAAMLWALFKLDDRLPKAYHIDDIVRTSVAFLGISGVLMSIPMFNQLGRALLRGVVSIAEAFNAGSVITTSLVSTVGVAFGAITIYQYYRKPTTGRLIWMTVGSYFLFSTDAGGQVVQWYADNIAVNVWNFVVDLYTRATGVRINLGQD